MKRLIFVMTIITMAGCSNNERPRNDNANDNTISRSEAVLLSENVMKTIAISESVDARNLDKIYLVGKTSEDSQFASNTHKELLVLSGCITNRLLSLIFGTSQLLVLKARMSTYE